MEIKIIDGNTYILYKKDIPNLAKLSVATMTKRFEKPLTERLKEMEDKNE